MMIVWTWRLAASDAWIGSHPEWIRLVIPINNIDHFSYFP